MDITQAFSPATIRTRPSSADLHADLKRAHIVAKFMDSQFSLFGIRFGADALVGLIPVAGDTLSLLPALYPIYVAQRHGLGRSLLLRMGWNIGVDWMVGLLPVLGDMLDVASKSNLKNVELLHKAAMKTMRR